MQVQKVAHNNYYWPNSIIFKMGTSVGVNSGTFRADEGPVTSTTARTRSALSPSRRRRKQAANVPRTASAREPRSRSSPERVSGARRPQRTDVPSLPAPTDRAAPAIPSSLLYNCSSNVPGTVAFYSPRPPPTPMYLVNLPPNPEPHNGTKTYATTNQQEKKCMSKKSKRIVRYVMQTLLRGVYKLAASRAMPPKVPVVSSFDAQDLSPAKTTPVFQSVASQTKPKSPFNRTSAVAVTDDASNSSEESCVECDATCAWAGNVRALRDSHVRLVLRQLQQLRDIERLDRTLHRARAAPHTRPAS